MFNNYFIRTHTQARNKQKLTVKQHKCVRVFLIYSEFLLNFTSVLENCIYIYIPSSYFCVEVVHHYSVFQSVGQGL